MKALRDASPALFLVFLAASVLLSAMPITADAQSASVTISVEVDNAEGAPAFPLELPGGTVSLGPGESTTVANAPDDQLRIIVPETEGYRVMGADCRRIPGGGTAAIRSNPDRSLLIETGSRANINCVLSYQQRRRLTMADITPRESSADGEPGSSSDSRQSMTRRPGEDSPSSGPSAERCEIGDGNIRDASAIAGNRASRCDFMIPDSWDVLVANDGLRINVIATRPCDADCRTPPSIALTIANGPNPNADAMAEAWPALMQTVGNGRCGEGAVQFFSTPGSDPNGLIGGVRFHLKWAGNKYDGGATFSCGEPGGWLRLQEQFIDTFHNNDGTTFDGR